MPITITRTDRRARVAVNAMFLTNGALVANLLPRYPEIKTQLGLDNTVYGFAVAAMPAGAIIAGLAAGWFIRRFNSARVATVGTMLASVLLVVVGISPNLWLFATALFAVGALDAVIDVAQNAHGLRVQRRYGRSILNSFHALWSAGAVLGGLMAAGAIAVRLPIGLHLGLSAAVFALVALVAQRLALPGGDSEERSAAIAEADVTDGTGPTRVPPRIVALLAALTLVAMGCTVVEDVANSWATLYLLTLGAPAAMAALGFVSLVGAQFIGRILGDRFVDKWGERAVARTGGLIAAVGMGLALLYPTVPGTMLGFAAAGFGVATLVPAAMHAADGLPGLRHGTGLTIVSWLMRLGFLLSPPLIGAIADSASLRAGLLTVPVAGLMVAVLASVLTGRRKNA